MLEGAFMSFMQDAPSGSGGEEFGEADRDDNEPNGIHRVPTFRVILTADCVIKDLSPIDDESDEVARSDATLRVCQSFNQALDIVNKKEGMSFNSIDFRIEANYHTISKDHPYGGFGEPGE